MKTIAIACCLHFLVVVQNYAQVTPTTWENIFQKALANYQAQQTPEKIYVHTDKSIYTNAETIWLKGYIVEGIRHTPTSLSKTVYVELWNEKAEKIAAQMLPVDSGVFVGNLSLPANMPTQTCTLRAYTTWQRNFDSNYLFEKTLHVFNLTTNSTTATPPKVEWVDSLQVQFFPEGGNFVTNLPNHIAFIISTSAGNRVQAKASLRNTTQQLLTTCHTVHEGMGAFDIVPNQAPYYLQIDSLFVKEQWLTPLQCGITHFRFPLPTSQTEGLTLQVNNLQAKEVLLQVQGSPTWGGKTLRLVAQCQGQLLLTSQFVLKNPYNLIKIPKNQLRTGLVQFTLFDEQNTPLAERLVFVHLQDHLQLSLQSTPIRLERRKQANFSLKVQATDDKTSLKGNFSVAIIRKDSISDKTATNHLLSELLLNNELRGNINHPAFYFQDQSPKTQHCLDLLLQTQGWRRFVWKELLVTDTSAFQNLQYAPEQGIVESGMIADKNQRPVPFAKVSLLALLPDGVQEILLVEADAKGNFSFSHQFPVGTELLISGKNGENNYQIVWKEPTTAMISRTQPQKNNYSNFHTLPRVYVEQQQKIQQIRQQYKVGIADQELQEVTVIGKKEVKTPPSTNIEFFGNPEQRIILQPNEVDGINNIANYLLGRVAGLQLLNGKLTLRGVSSFMANAEVKVMIDGIFVEGTESTIENGKAMASSSAVAALREVNPVDIASIEIYKGGSAAAFGARGTNGVLAITTKRGEMHKASTNKTVRNYEPKSYSLVKEFYVPDYSQANPQHTQPDFRSTVFWLPTLKTNEKGEALFSFYNGDDTGTYQIVIEGMTTEGKMGRLVQEIESR